MSTDLLEVYAPREDHELISMHRGHSRLAISGSSRFARKKRLVKLPTTRLLLTGGGDGRIVCGPDGCNRYGCSSLPEPDVLAFGSSTASTVSPSSFAAADLVRQRIEGIAEEEAPAIYERELDRVRRELKTLCDLDDLPGLEIIFGASGTDLHLFASQLIGETEAGAPLIVRAEATETGRGVPDALVGRHFGDCTPLGQTVNLHDTIEGARSPEILEVKCRTSEGAPRLLTEIDAEVEEAVRNAVAAGRRVLLTLVDVAKTGLLAPSPGCVLALRRSFPEAVEVLVDACQFRLASETLRAYLENDFLVAITGSKFITGPTFCGALFVPRKPAGRLCHRTLPAGFASYSTRAEWPRSWSARAVLLPVANFGLLLRWEAALAELRAFRSLPERAIAGFLVKFADTVSEHLIRHPAFEFLPGPALDRRPLVGTEGWDSLPTIFSFLLVRRSSTGERICLTQAETRRVHELLREDLTGLGKIVATPVLSRRCQLGQPVSCGVREGVPVSALRLCVGTRQIVDALAPTGRGVEPVLADAMAALEKTAFLAAMV